MKIDKDRIYSFAMKIEDGYCEIGTNIINNEKSRKKLFIIKKLTSIFPKLFK